MSADNRASALGAGDADGWSVVVPVKHGARGKSRLEVPGVDRAALARAIALDTIDAVARAARVAEVVVVTDDPVIRAALSRTSASPDGESDSPHGDAGTDAEAPDRPDSGDAPDRSPSLRRWTGDPGQGLNAAVAAGLEAARGRAAALLGDVPALRPADLDAALSQAGEGPAVVADADGTGTTLLTDATPGILRFGPGSFAAHVEAGARPLDVPATSTLRHDVDTADQLDAARALGLGPRTAALTGIASRSRS